MKRKDRMTYFVNKITKILQHLQITQANETEVRALYYNLVSSHTDIFEKYVKNDEKDEIDYKEVLLRRMANGKRSFIYKFIIPLKVKLIDMTEGK